METGYITEEIKRNKIIFEGLLKNLPEEMYLWKTNPEKWCLLEILCHLFDEEREDFKARINHIFENPELPLPPIDPAGWVTKRKYNEQNYDVMLSDFLKERNKSIEWLDSLVNPGWNSVHRHPKLGEMTARGFFENWLAHDYLHIRQIIKVKYEYLNSKAGDSLNYAGSW